MSSNKKRGIILESFFFFRKIMRGIVIIKRTSKEVKMEKSS